MNLYLKIIGAALVTLFLGMATGRDFSLLLSIAVCVMAAALVMELLEPVFALIADLKSAADLPQELGKILMKVVGVGLLSEIAAMLCADGGNGSLAKMLKLASTAMILYLSVPLLRSVLSVLKELLGVV